MSGMTVPADMQSVKTIPVGHLFVAQVKDNNDPEHQQRLRITVPNLIEGDTSSLPWAIPMARAGGTSNVELDVPAVDSYVIVMFQGGDRNSPVWFGSLQASYNGSSSIAGTNYPNRVGRQTQATTYWYVDKTTNQVHLRHGATTFTINSDGSVTIVSGGAMSITVTGAVTLNASGNVDITSSGNVNVTAALINLN